MAWESDRAIDECGCILELVWDDGLNATALTSDASPIRIGPAASLLPHQLLALAASSCLMTSFLTLAAGAGVPIHGYVSSARLADADDGGTALALAPCVVVASEDDALRAAQLWSEAIRHSRTLGLLKDRVQVEPAVRVAPPMWPP
jgi:organic hydroperoxide reductase OsmC/OhrA